MNAIQLPEARFAGRYRLQVHGPDGREKADTGWIDNLITDAGLEALGEAKAIARYCMVGTGNTAPANGNTALVAQIASQDYTTSVGASTTRSVQTTGTRYGREVRTWKFAQGAVVGNIAEVGVGWSTTAVFSRALISPVVSVTSIDQLTVTYELRMYVPTVDATGSATIGGTSYNYTIRAAYADSSTAAGGGFGWGPQLLSLLAATRAWVDGSLINVATAYAAPAVVDQVNDTFMRVTAGGAAATSLGQCSALSNAAYSANSKECQFTLTFGTDYANGNFRGLIYTGLFGTYQMQLDANVPKDNTKQLTLTLKQTWARH